MTKADQKAKAVVAAWPDYSGKRVFLVRHPDYASGGIRVLAPDEDAAMVTAARYWERRWQEIRFYAYCDIMEVYE